MQNPANHSYWEFKQYFTTYDLIVIGSGIVGLNTAISFKEKHKEARVMVLEKGILPDGASTKNAGFACFGSAGELLSDFSKYSFDDVAETLRMRCDGLHLLRKRIGDKKLGYRQYGGYELFRDKQEFNAVAEGISDLNRKLEQIIGISNCYNIADHSQLYFAGTAGAIYTRHEGQVDTGMMMKNLISLAHKKQIIILNNISVESIHDTGELVEVCSAYGTFRSKKLVVATNGYAKQLLKIADVKPARAQVLITSEIPRLPFKGTFHFDEGYYYFRNIDKRVLFGGGRNLDFKGETTTERNLNAGIQKELDRLLETMILPGIKYSVERRWTGIMGMGEEKKAIIKPVSGNVVAAVRMGGMGIAIGSLVGKKAADLCV